MTLLNLCQLADVKRRLGIDDTEQDTLLTSLIGAVSAAIEQYCNRSFYLEERTEEYNVSTAYAGIPLRAYPVSAIASVKNNSAWEWATTTALDASSYRASLSGVLHFRSALSKGPLALQVVYTAGLASDTATLVAGWPDLAGAAEMQVVEEFLRKDTQGKVTYSLTDGGGTGQQEGLELLKVVKQRLGPYRRRSL